MNQKAFTLIELLVVVAIIGILAAVGVVADSGYQTAAKKNVVKKQHRETVNYLKTELLKCEMDLGFDYVMDGHLKCSDRNTTNEIGKAAVKAFHKKFNNPYKSWRENSVALNGPHGEGTSDPGKCFDFNYGGIMVSNIPSGSYMLVRISTCAGEPRAIYESFVIE